MQQFILVKHVGGHGHNGPLNFSREFEIERPLVDFLHQPNYWIPSSSWMREATPPMPGVANTSIDWDPADWSQGGRRKWGGGKRLACLSVSVSFMLGAAMAVVHHGVRACVCAIGSIAGRLVTSKVDLWSKRPYALPPHMTYLHSKTEPSMKLFWACERRPMQEHDKIYFPKHKSITWLLNTNLSS